MDTNSLAHTKWECKYHIVFAPKYRRQVIYKDIKADVGQILGTLCRRKGIEIIEAECCSDHIHMLVRIPPKYSVSEIVGYLKGKSTLMIYDRHPELQSKWDKSFLARGYYVETIGNITDEAVQKYIREQAEESRKEDSRGTSLQRTSKSACDIRPLGASSRIALRRANNKPPVELVVVTSYCQFLRYEQVRL